MKCLLDTNVLAGVQRSRDSILLNRFWQKWESHELFTSTIVVSELWYGAFRSEQQERNARDIEEILRTIRVMPYPHSAGVIYGRLRSELETRGERIGWNDMLIAAHAIAEDCVLVSHNLREFQRVKGLRLEDWTE